MLYRFIFPATLAGLLLILKNGSIWRYKSLCGLSALKCRDWITTIYLVWTSCVPSTLCIHVIWHFTSTGCCECYDFFRIRPLVSSHPSCSENTQTVCKQHSDRGEGEGGGVRSCLAVLCPLFFSAVDAFCQNLVETLEGTPGLRYIWSTFKQLLQGKVLYTPDTPAVRLVVKEVRTMKLFIAK